jgi:Tfp pilus assembly protein PilO
MLASPTSRWSAGAVLLTLLVLVASWFLLIGPRRDQASTLTGQTMSAQSQATSLQTQIAQLKSDFGNLPKHKAELAAIKQQLPAAADMPSLVRNLQDYAAAAGVSLDSLAPGTPVIFGAGAGGASAGSGTTGLVQAGGVVEIPLSMSVSGDYFEDALFVKALQTKLARAFLITGLATSQDASSGVLPTPLATALATPGATPGATPSATPGVIAAPVATSAPSTALQISGSVFVLADETTSLSSVDAAAKAAAKAASPAARASAPATAQASAS